MPQAPISFENTRHFSISGCNFGEVRGAFVVNPSESLTTRSRRRSKAKNQKTHSRSVRSSPTATTGSGVDSQFQDSGNDADGSESGSETSLSERSTWRPEAPIRIRNSAPHVATPQPSSIYSYGSPSVDDRRRRSENLCTTPQLPFPPISPPIIIEHPPISAYPQYRPPVRSAPARCINCDCINRDTDLGRHAPGLNANSGHAARAYSMPHRSGSSFNLVDIPQSEDVPGRNGQRPSRRRSGV